MKFRGGPLSFNGGSSIPPEVDISGTPRQVRTEKIAAPRSRNESTWNQFTAQIHTTPVVSANNRNQG